MKMCQPHWDRLKAAIEHRGLGHLIAANARDAHARAVSDLKGESDPTDFDPLMSATWMIYGKATQDLGLGIMGVDDKGEQYCPVCEWSRAMPQPPSGHRYADNESYMLDGPADAVLDDAKNLGLWPASSDLPSSPTEDPSR